MTFKMSEAEQTSLKVIGVIAIIGLLYAVILGGQILSLDTGTPRMQEIARAIQEGAAAYIKRQFSAIAVLIVVLAGVLYVTGPASQAGEPDIALGRSVAFLMGSLFSALIGSLGMYLAVRANVRTAAAAASEDSPFSRALTTAFRAGSVVGMFTIGMGLLGATIIFHKYTTQANQVLVGFGFGGSLIALFMRVGGGIFTKAADVGADLVGKVEAGIPEDDPRNPAVIADNVGDNVGDCAGMAADIFESYEVTLVASMILGYAVFPERAIGVIFPLLVRAIGVVGSIVGVYFVKARSETESAMAPINRGFAVASAVSIVGFAIATYFYVDSTTVPMGGDPLNPITWVRMRVFIATLSGIILALAVSKLTEYYTSTEHHPVQEIAKSTQTGAATTILSGFAVGLESTVFATWLICGAIFVSYVIAGGNVHFTMYCIALAGMGMLTTTGIIVSEDTFGPISDNAQGIGEMAHLSKPARDILTRLDAVGNTTKAITKGFAIGSAVVAAVSLFGSYIAETGLPHIDLADPRVFIGLLIGGSVPFLFSSLMVRAVGRAAFLIVYEVRRQFREIPGLLEGLPEAKADYASCVSICTEAAQKELIGPGLLAVLAPVVVGILFEAPGLGGFLAGIILCGQLMAVFLSNAGGSWDNAKKAVEDGAYGGKGSDCHKAAVVGDTVGDPFKDTAGPALNPLIKVMNLVALLIAPKLALGHYEGVGFGTGLMALLAIALVFAAIWKSRQEAPAAAPAPGTAEPAPAAPAVAGGQAS
ncbi:MAG: sodium-translocating pyrophosphatase [Candidatus Wallbacteria bacterium]|nr:sodium-translocating pyrophosphatase [Candidatus Wallbacteria bacterium]